MKEKVSIIAITIMFLCQAMHGMEIHTYCEDKEECIRTEAGSFNDDYLFMGHELNFSGQAEDLIFLGKRLTFSGVTKNGLFSFCEKMIFSGASGNGIISGAMEILIDGKVASNSFIACKNLTLSDKSEVNGDLFAGCAKLVIDGVLNGGLYAGAGEILINNEINGNVHLFGGRIVFGQKGKINGNLVYSTKEKIESEDSAKITGMVKYDEKFKNDKDLNTFTKFKTTAGLLFGLGLTLSFLIVGSLLLFLPAFKKLDTPQTEKTFWRTSLWGLIPVLMYPAVVVLSFIMIVTIPFGVLLVLGFLPLFSVAYIIGVTLLGKYIVKKLKWKVEKRHFHFLIGILAGFILTILPFIDFFVFLFISTLGWGTFLAFLFNKELSFEENGTSQLPSE